MWVFAHNDKMDICSKVGTNVRKLRNELGISQEELAVRAEMDR